MNETALLRELNADRQSAPSGKVIYLEGKTDPPIFFALLGVQPPRDDLHQGVLVRGLGAGSGSGAKAVRIRVELAARNGYPGIYGVVDGDGRALAGLAAEFDAPYVGPIFSWKAYCIENLLAKTGWPAAWGAPPDWKQTLLDHVPYTALNAIHAELKGGMRTLGLAAFTHPTLDAPLKTADDVLAALERDKHLLANLDVASLFSAYLVRLRAAIERNLDEGHTHVNGRWLVDVHAPRVTASRVDRCRDTWIQHAASSGGLAEVRALWERITGRAP